MLLSAIMITGHMPERRTLARVAVRCFREQSLESSSRELVVINTGEPLGLRGTNIREIVTSQAPHITLGDLRNMALEAARGEWIIQWDDDDWHHPERCEAQLELASEQMDCCVLLGSQLRCSLLCSRRFVEVQRAGIHGTILHHCSVPYRYRSVHKAEDTHFMCLFKSRRVLRGMPHLYCRLYHGRNTWDFQHIMGMRDGCGRELSAEQDELLQETILPNYVHHPHSIR